MLRHRYSNSVSIWPCHNTHFACFHRRTTEPFRSARARGVPRGLRREGREGASCMCVLLLARAGKGVGGSMG